MEDIAEGRFGNQVPTPIEDVLLTYEYILSLSPSTVPTEIDLAQKSPVQHRQSRSRNIPAEKRATSDFHFEIAVD